MNLNEKAANTVRKLLKLTRENKIAWSRSTDTHHVTRGSDDRVTVVYTAKYAEVRFRVYEASYQDTMDGETLYWSHEPRVEIIDYDETVVWSLPRVSEMLDLLETIRVKSGNVEESLDKFLNEEL